MSRHDICISKCMASKTHIIGLMGASGSGKDTCSTFIRTELGQVRTLAFADPFKELASIALDLPHANLWGPSPQRNEHLAFLGEEDYWTSRRAFMERYLLQPRVGGWASKVTLSAPSSQYSRDIADAVMAWYSVAANESVQKGGNSVRRILQTLASDYCRAVNPNIWVDFTMNEIRFHASDGVRAVVVTDVRIENEVRTLLGAGAEVWRLTRDTKDLPSETINHSAESDLRRLEVQAMATRVIDNANMTINETQAEIRRICATL